MQTRREPSAWAAARPTICKAHDVAGGLPQLGQPEPPASRASWLWGPCRKLFINFADIFFSFNDVTYWKILDLWQHLLC